MSNVTLGWAEKTVILAPFRDSERSESAASSEKHVFVRVGKRGKKRAALAY